MAPTLELALKLSALRYKHPDISEKDFHEYASQMHAAKAAAIQQRNGALKVSQLHTPSPFRDIYRNQMAWAVQPGWGIDDHDLEVSVWVRDVETMAKIVTDPDFQALTTMETHIIDVSRGTLRAGWEEVYVEDGKIVEVPVGGYGEYEEKIRLATEAKGTMGVKDIVL